jgi:hypothetical protein
MVNMKHQLTSQSVVSSPSITEILKTFVDEGSADNSTALDFLLENMTGENQDDFLKRVATEIIVPESIKDYEDQTYSHRFLSYILTKNYLNVPNEKYDQLYNTFKSLIGKDILIKIDADSYPIEVILSLTSWGRKIIIDVILVAPSLYPLFFKTIDQGPLQGVSVALNCLLDDDTAPVCLEKIKVFSHLKAHHLNTIVHQGLYSGASIAYCLARKLQGRILLASDKDRLAKLINAESLNAVIQSGPDAGQSVAYWLVSTTVGQRFLSLNENYLAKLINAESLNAVIQSGPDAGKSVA